MIRIAALLSLLVSGILTSTGVLGEDKGPAELPVQQASPVKPANVEVPRQIAPQDAVTGPEWVAPNKYFLYFVVLAVVMGMFAGIVALRGSLAPSGWSLADALSEETSLPTTKEVTDASGTKTVSPMLDAAGNPVLAPQMRASSSRLIALMGMMVIVFLYIGFGVLTLYSWGMTGKLPQSLDRVVYFLAGGMTLFAPYVVNKFSTLFQGLGQPPSVRR